MINFFWQSHPLLFNFIEFPYHMWCLFFFYHVLKLGQEVDPSRVLSHGLSRITEVTRVNWIFYCVGSKNNIILIKKIMAKKKKSTDVDMIFS